MKSGGKSKPVYRYSHGDVTVSVWKAKLRAHHDFGDVQVYTGYRACVRRSIWDHRTGRWRSQVIWMDDEELDHSATALDTLYAHLDNTASNVNEAQIAEAAANSAAAEQQSIP